MIEVDLDEDDYEEDEAAAGRTVGTASVTDHRSHGSAGSSQASEPTPVAKPRTSDCTADRRFPGVEPPSPQGSRT